MSHVTKITQCRICGNTQLQPILDLGSQVLTGVFPTSRDQQVTAGPLELVKCDETARPDACGLVQLRHSYSLDEMYGMNYGYRSGLNRSMVQHLRELVETLRRRVSLAEGDCVLDIGSNDGTLLSFYPPGMLNLVGMDPSAAKFREYYRDDIRVITDFFSAETFRQQLGDRKARVVTSIAMFYDLESPLDFMRQVREILADDGVWVFEQSYMPTMLARNAYDTVCHEHLLYYGLRQIKWLTDRSGLKIVDVELNDVNGGSFCVTAALADSPHTQNTSRVRQLLEAETHAGLDGLKPYAAFRESVFRHRDELRAFLAQAAGEGKTVLGLGASTKGNVILQFCGLGEADIPCIAEINEDKFGSFTPGTLIPIVPEAHARAQNPDYFLVLPWHFEESITSREQNYLSAGGRLLFPLPTIHTVEAKTQSH